MDYRDAYLFRGFASRAGTSARFHSLCWPNRYAEIRETRSWKERALLTMVAGNKNRGFFGSKRSIKAFVRGAMDLAGWRYYQIIDELLRFPDYYKQRSAAIEHFAEERWFSLYGKGWDGVEWVSSPKGRRRFANRPHACKDKVQTMGGYKFNLCFENCAFPGYVTEKIFDSFFAGCVPVYFGAPDIEEFIPKECFIDYRAIGSFGELGRFLLEMAEREWLQKREAIVDFLSSSAYQRYRQENIAEEMVACLLEEH